MTELRVHMRHARQVAKRGGRITCAPGIRAWCASQGIDLHRLNGEGIPESEALRIGGHFAMAALEIARQEQARKEAADGQQ